MQRFKNNKIFYENKLKRRHFRNLLNKFWHAPCDALLRAPEVAIWSSIKPKHPILDIGCADGRMDDLLFKNMGIDVGLDSNEKFIPEARESGLYKKVVLSGAEEMPFKSNSFNSAISNSTFEHIEKDLESVKEVSRVLKKNGDFIFTTTTDKFLNTIKEIGVKGDRLKRYNKRVEHFHYRSVNEWKKILNENGFKDVWCRYYFPPRLVKTWWLLFQITTFKVYRRELWSYLQDSPYGKIFPAGLISKILYLLLRNQYKQAFDKNGCWVFIWAKKS